MNTADELLKMPGINKLHINAATMIKIVQRWLDVEMPNAQPVSNVVMRDDNHYQVFVVTLGKSGEPT